MPVGNRAEDKCNHASRVNWGEAVGDVTHHTQAQTDTSIAVTLTLLPAPPAGGWGREKEKKKQKETGV